MSALIANFVEVVRFVIGLVLLIVLVIVIIFVLLVILANVKLELLFVVAVLMPLDRVKPLVVRIKVLAARFMVSEMVAALLLLLKRALNWTLLIEMFVSDSVNALAIVRLFIFIDLLLCIVIVFVSNAVLLLAITVFVETVVLSV